MVAVIINCPALFVWRQLLHSAMFCALQHIVGTTMLATAFLAAATSTIDINRNNNAANVVVLDDGNNNNGGEGPLRSWNEQRMVRCIFCMNYDDYNNLSTFGCEQRRVNTCWGNFCYMRQHKRPEYFLYTSGCINLTVLELAAIRSNVALLAASGFGAEVGGSSGRRRPAAAAESTTNWTNETQLCEVGQSVNTCLCTNRHLCNNVTVVEPYIEYTDAIFGGIDFDELAHFRFLLPDDPILHEFERERHTSLSSLANNGADGTAGSADGAYMLVKDSPPSSSSSSLMASSSSSSSSSAVFIVSLFAMFFFCVPNCAD